ncbi:hypothetical protein A3742_27685 [Oleiphilus sp. HI0071]|jgi:hypothetical protein|uniref:hypothetical protein n=1 Tax=unclassified Oleiphilus TaxID=2631174 RepID=UPI0007C3EE23|nr:MULTISPECIES: hypothetical protein [unclassified Oleiphilus]KZY69934.1 hypothetical protein A3737_30780 [Oleiphilus sp. HI0065]KZY82975.1 hypothetical protein A3742_00680 [Oleiphilus sp. HI0071]KZY92142.1 hypothetical protein A3744_19760 [Oleiphilus sp. HI0073]KZZ40681.1 hypothetical protein A3758_08130 [Oleiphilus sp. HI0118]KZZ48284.1 hypothetical protein A3760_23775 [Oleiphilus sp. HI0122]KZZ66850.1 hypothetical protein A3765_04915 [Oleiphilus sp. HI0130]KZZ82285.1 hypothetical protein
MDNKKSLVIRFVDGSMVSFDFAKQVLDPMQLVKNIDNALKQPYMSVEAEGALHLYPRENIKSIQVYPSPEKLPDYVIRGAEYSAG